MVPLPYNIQGIGGEYCVHYTTKQPFIVYTTLENKVIATLQFTALAFCTTCRQRGTHHLHYKNVLKSHVAIRALTKFITDISRSHLDYPSSIRKSSSVHRQECLTSRFHLLDKSFSPTVRFLFHQYTSVYDISPPLLVMAYPCRQRLFSFVAQSQLPNNVCQLRRS